MIKVAEETKIALIQKDLENIKISQDRMEIKMDALQGIFWTTKGHEEFVQDVNKRFSALESRTVIEKVVIFVVSSVITFLAISFFQHK